MRHALVTGGAGFIGSHLVDRLLAEGWKVTVVDNFCDFYDPAIKRQNITQHLPNDRYTLVTEDIRNLAGLQRQLTGNYDVIVHLAAMAGVRPSIDNPVLYQEVNVQGTQHMLELARAWGVKQFVFASSSSVYGVNPNVPWREEDHGLQPISPYAATKVAGELLGHVYSHLYGIRFLALRFFTVYGPRQRPDLAIHKFAQLMLRGMPIPVYGDGATRRDYTFVEDVVEGIRRAIDYTLTPYEVLNLGNDRTVGLIDAVRTLEAALGISARLEHLPPQLGDVPMTWASLEKAQRLIQYKPRSSFDSGVHAFAAWIRGRTELWGALQGGSGEG